MQPSPEAYHISQNFQVDFDKVLCNALEKHHSSPGFTLLLGSILQYRNLKQLYVGFPPGLVAYLYLVRQQGKGHILDDMGFSGITETRGGVYGTKEFLLYFTDLLENPERSGAYAFDRQRCVTAAKECLQLCLCNHHKFSKGAMDSAYHDKVLLRNKPWVWKVRQGAHSRLPKAIQWRKSFETRYIHQDPHFPLSSSEHEHYRSLAYEWALRLLPIFLEECTISLELADVLRTWTFTTMAQQFPWKMRLAREAITSYLFRVDSAV